MGPGYFIIAILGCADGSATCTPVATVPTRFESEAQCSAAAPDALLARSDLDFPSLLAECKAIKQPAGAKSEDRPERLPQLALNG